MPYYVEVPLSNGQVVLAEVTSQVDDVVPAGKGKDIVGRLPDALRTGLRHITTFAGDALAGLGDLDETPDVISMEFGVMLSAKAGCVVAESTGQAHVKIAVEWHPRRVHDQRSQSQTA